MNYYTARNAVGKRQEERREGVGERGERGNAEDRGGKGWRGDGYRKLE